MNFFSFAINFYLLFVVILRCGLCAPEYNIAQIYHFLFNFATENDSPMFKKSAFVALIFCAVALMTVSCKGGRPGDDNADYAAQVFWRGRARRTAAGFETGHKVKVKRFPITKYGVVKDSMKVQTEAIQKAIDAASASGSGEVVIPRGVWMSGALFFKPGTTLYLEDGAVLKGSDDISDYPVRPSRMEGQCLDYIPALVNADGVDGFAITGLGTIDGNGAEFWDAFWARREENPKCTNLEVLRPRLVFISNSKNVLLEGVWLRNSAFWTTHLYKCEDVNAINLTITAPHEPVKAASSDAIDIDACRNVHIVGCRMSVCDDAVVLKGGKGPWADTAPENGGNFNILVESCDFGYCYGALVLGSESVRDSCVVMRNCRLDGAKRILWLKMRPDTPQVYEDILVEDISGNAKTGLYIHPWTQFFDLKDRRDIPRSYARNVTLRNISVECRKNVDVELCPEQYTLTDFTLPEGWTF